MQKSGIMSVNIFGQKFHNYLKFILLSDISLDQFSSRNQKNVEKEVNGNIVCRNGKEIMRVRYSVYLFILISIYINLPWFFCMFCKDFYKLQFDTSFSIHNTKLIQPIVFTTEFFNNILIPLPYHMRTCIQFIPTIYNSSICM